MARWIKVGSVGDFPEGKHLCMTADEKPIVVFRIENRFYAIANVCPHAGLPLGQGDRHGFVLTCPFHGYAYDIRNGRNIDWPYDELPVKTYPVRVEGEMVQVALNPDRD